VRLEWWERLGGFLLQFRALRILMRVRMVLTWVSLLIMAVTLAVSPVARTVLGAWIGCFWIVAVCFWLARGKTVSWGMTSGIFAISMPWAGAVGWISFQVAAAARVPVDHAASQVVIAGVVEELAKLAPICLVTVIAPGRVRRLLIQDWLVLGVACGAGFMAVEEVARRLAFILGNTPGLQLSKAICPESPAGIVECMQLLTFSPWPFSDGFPGPVAYAGHAIVTGLGRGNAVSIYSYIANALVSVICIVVAWRATRPLFKGALRDVPRLRSVRGVRIVNTAGPQLLQSLAIPIAFQTDRLLLSHLGQSQALAEYNLANNLFNMLTQTVMAAGVAMWPMFARARADKRIESPFKPAIAFSGGGFLLALALVAITPWAARVMSHGKIVLPTVLVWAFAAYVAVEAGKQPLGMYMTDPRGLQFQVIPVLILVPMNLAISWVLIGPFDAAGPILGSVISVVLCQILPYAWWVRRDVARRRRELAQR